MFYILSKPRDWVFFFWTGVKFLLKKKRRIKSGNLCFGGIGMAVDCLPRGQIQLGVRSGVTVRAAPRI